LSNPLDYEEKEISTERPRGRKSAFLELIPMALIVIGLYLRNKGNDAGSDFLILGGALASLFYLLFSWYMFKVEEYKKGEVFLSILVGLIFPLGILGLVGYYESWAYSSLLVNIALMSAGGLFVLCLALFIYNFRDERASIFYRNILTRLLIFSALLIRLHPDIFL
jgi:hypothetical protein